MVRLLAVTVFIAATAHAGPALAGQDDHAKAMPVPEMIEKLFECRKIAEPAPRLACLDQQTAAIEAATKAKDLVIADREQIKEARRGLFGLSLPKIGLFGGGGDKDEEPIAKVESTLQSASPASGGKWLLVLEDGARWLQSDSTPVLGSPKAGDAIVIERAAMGSYMAKIGKRRAFRVQRIN